MTPWHWIGFSLVIMCVELFIGTPGVALIWLGMAGFGLAMLISFISINFWVQLLLLAFIALILGGLYRNVSKKFFAMTHNALNQRSQNFIGTIMTLDHPIKNGCSRIRIGDSIWRIEGPDLSAGTKVEIINVKGNALIVCPQNNAFKE